MSEVISIQAAMSEEGAIRFRQSLAELTYEVRDPEHPELSGKMVNYLVGLAMTGLQPTWKIAAHVASGTEEQLRQTSTHVSINASVQVSA